MTCVTRLPSTVTALKIKDYRWSFLFSAQPSIISVLFHISLTRMSKFSQYYQRSMDTTHLSIVLYCVNIHRRRKRGGGGGGRRPPPII